MRYEAELIEVDFDTTTEGMYVEQKLFKLYCILENITALVFQKSKEFIAEGEKKEEDKNKKNKSKIPKEI